MSTGRWGPEGPSEEAYSSVTNTERFRPLHQMALELFIRLEAEFDVDRIEGYGLDSEIENRFELARPPVRLTPRGGSRGPITIVFTAFPGIVVRVGRWHTDWFPNCGCNACDETAAGEVERLNEVLDDVTAGRFGEAIEIPWSSFMRSGWVETKFWSPDESRSSTRSRFRVRVDRVRALEMSGGGRRLNVNWKPWLRRQPPHDTASCSCNEP